MATLSSLKSNFKVAEGLISEITTRVKDTVPSEELDKLRLANEELRREVEKLTETLTMIEIVKGQAPTYYLHYMTPSGGTLTSAKADDVVKAVPGGRDKSDSQVAPGVTPKAENFISAAESEKKPADGKENAPKQAKAKVGNAPAQATAAAEVVDISRLDMRVGKIVHVDRHPEADSLYLEKIEVGEPQPRTVISGLVKHIPIEEMQNRLVVVLCNLKPAKMRGIVSEAMVMCASTPEKVEILAPPASAIPGDVIEFEGYTRNPDPVLNPKKKIFETVAPDLQTNADKIATYKGVPFNITGKGFVTAQTLAGVNIK